jgi:hypothetical protein
MRLSARRTSQISGMAVMPSCPPERLSPSTPWAWGWPDAIASPWTLIEIQISILFSTMRQIAQMLTTDIESVLDLRVEKPQVPDTIQVINRGIKINVVGILHGLTGGTNKEYAASVRAVADNLPRPILGEHLFKKLYPGCVDEEVGDFLAIPLRDSFRLAFWM